MYKGKYMRQEAAPAKKRNYRPLALILALVLVVGSAVYGTLAWLIADTDPVVNTFTYGDINLKLEETETDEKGNPVTDDNGDPVKTTEGNDYEMLPGEKYLKDPAVTVLAGNEACWLFVKLEKNGGVTITNGDGSTTTYDFDDYLTYTIADGWTQLYEEKCFGVEGHEVEGVYYRFVAEGAKDTDAVYNVLQGDTDHPDGVITVLGTVTKDMLNALDNNGQDAANATYPSLSVTAYAVQYSGFVAEVSDGADSATNEQVNTAAQKAWEAVEAQSATTEP